MSKASSSESFFPPLWIITLIFLALFFWLLMQLKEMVVLLVVGYCIAYIAHPLLQRMEKHKISRGVGFFVLSSVFAIFVTILAMTAAPTIARQYQVLTDNLPQYITIARERAKPIIEKAKSYVGKGKEAESGSKEEFSIDALLSKISGNTVQTVLAGISGALLQGYSVTLFLANLILLPFIVFYIAIDFDKIHSWFLNLFPKDRRKKVSQIASEINVYVSAFVRGQLMVCSILFILYALGLWTVGVELWFLLAVISGFGNMIPYFGFLCGIVLSSVMALVTFGDFSHVVQVWIVFATVQFLEGFIITPKVMGEKVGFSPLTIILAIFAGGTLFGLLGVFLAIPGAAVVKVVGSHLHSWILTKSAA